MIKPAKCETCGEIPEIDKWLIHDPQHRWSIYCHPMYCKSADVVFARTRIGAILRWNWKQWRARRKSKGEAT